MDISIIATWAPVGMFAITGLGIFMKVSAFMTRTELLLLGQDKRIRKLEKARKRDKKATTGVQQ